MPKGYCLHSLPIKGDTCISEFCTQHKPRSQEEEEEEADEVRKTSNSEQYSCFFSSLYRFTRKKFKSNTVQWNTFNSSKMSTVKGPKEEKLCWSRVLSNNKISAQQLCCELAQKYKEKKKTIHSPFMPSNVEIRLLFISFLVWKLNVCNKFLLIAWYNWMVDNDCHNALI